MRITTKQRQILEAICTGIRNDENHRVGWLDAQMVCDAVPYEVSIHSMKISLRFLGEKGLVEKCDPVLRRERWVVPVKPTDLAFDYIYRRDDPRMIEHESEVVELYL